MAQETTDGYEITTVNQTQGEHTMSQPVKIVDDFNGYEGPTYTESAEAEQDLAQRRRDFYAHPGHRNAHFRQTIVPATYTWHWDQVQNLFIWS